MKLLAVLVLLAGCGRPDPCPAARKAATDAVDKAQHAARTEVEVLQNAADEAPQRTQLELVRIDFDEKLEALEAAMDCIDHDDCCARLPKLADRTKSATLLRELMAITPVPASVLAALTSSVRILDRADAGPASPVAAEITAWCTHLRTEINRVRVVGPDEWKKMEDAADVDEDSSNAAMAAVQKRLDALQAWRAAITTKKKPSPPPDPTMLDEARPAISFYVATCKL